MRGGARQGIRRWQTVAGWAAMVGLIVVCLLASPAQAQQSADVEREREAPAVIDVRELNDSIRQSIEETSVNLRKLREELDVEIPGIPNAPRVVILSEGIDSTVLEDSIYASEIHADAGGVLIVNRDGQRFHIVGLAGLPPIPPVDRPDVDDAQAQIFQMFSDVITIEPDEVIDGDVVSIFGGHIEVLGRVNGSVVS
ncbi:MAG: hypothetical protein GF341_00110, partial [candidate division Zixibacteria bacterium]|nr:hypothetical protein [candidate division Zixibacteria bacterium]